MGNSHVGKLFHFQVAMGESQLGAFYIPLDTCQAPLHRGVQAQNSQPRWLELNTLSWCWWGFLGEL